MGLDLLHVAILGRWSQVCSRRVREVVVGFVPGVRSIKRRRLEIYRQFFHDIDCW